MSTWIYLRCVSHDPPIQADCESGQHLVPDLENTRQIFAQREELVRIWNQHDGELWPSDENRYTRNTVRFLAQHPTCEIELWDEYRQQHSLELEGESPMVEEVLCSKCSGVIE